MPSVIDRLAELERRVKRLEAEKENRDPLASMWGPPVDVSASDIYLDDMYVDGDS